MGVYKTLALAKVKSKVNGLVKEKRLIFLGDNKCEYTNKDGYRQRLNFDGMVNVFLNAGGVTNYVQAGITPDDIKKYIIEAYEKEVKSK